MSDLISRTRALKKLRYIAKRGIKGKDGMHPISAEVVIAYIESLPTIDAEPVVRCKDCKHYTSMWYCEAWNNSPGFPAVRDDMFLMSRCSHNIMANSSYSWWGAFLNENKDKTVICPETGVWGGDFYPEGWMKVTASSGK
jgi:hypothetical protein